MTKEKTRELEREMTQNGVVTGGRTIVVGVKFDAASSELLDWALVKVAEPGDTVIALHIITNGTFRG